MKRYKIIALTAVLVILLSACQANITPAQVDKNAWLNESQEETMTFRITKADPKSGQQTDAGTVTYSIRNATRNSLPAYEITGRIVLGKDSMDIKSYLNADTKTDNFLRPIYTEKTFTYEQEINNAFVTANYDEQNVTIYAKYKEAAKNKVTDKEQTKDVSLKNFKVIYDNETLALALRALPLKEGYNAMAASVVLHNGASQPIRIGVTGKEQAKVPENEKAYECYVVSVGANTMFAGEAVYMYYSVEGHKLVKMRQGEYTYELAQYAKGMDVIPTPSPSPAPTAVPTSTPAPTAAPSAT